MYKFLAAAAVAVVSLIVIATIVYFVGQNRTVVFHDGPEVPLPRMKE